METRAKHASTQRDRRRARLAARGTGRAAARSAVLAALLLAVSGVACSRDEAPTSADAPVPAGAAAVSPGARRIASLSPLASALLLELEARDRIVAVDPESAALAGLGGRPQIPADDERAFLALGAVDPDLIVLPAIRAELAARLASANHPTVVVAVRDFDDGFTLWNDLAGRLGVSASARDRIAAAARRLSPIEARRESAQTAGAPPRPRIAAIERFSPLALSGDRGFAAALVRIAGGELVPAPETDPERPLDLEALRALAPALLVHVSATPIPVAERRTHEAALAGIAPLVFLELDPDRFFAPEAAEAARTLEAAIAPLASAPAAAP